MGSATLCGFLAGAVLLLPAGVSKLRDPGSLVRALRSVGLPAAPALVRVAAAAEVLIGVAAIVRPSRLTGVLVALSYLTFTAFVALALARGGVLGSCGCFGRPDTPPTRSHLLVTGLLTVSAAAVAVAPPPSDLWTVAVHEPLLLATVVGFALLLAWLSYLVIAVLPTITPAAVRSASAPQRG